MSLYTSRQSGPREHSWCMHPHPLVFTIHTFDHVHGLVFRRLCMEMRGSKQLSNPDYWNSAFAGASSGLLLHGLLGTFTIFSNLESKKWSLSAPNSKTTASCCLLFSVFGNRCWLYPSTSCEFKILVQSLPFVKLHKRLEEHVYT